MITREARSVVQTWVSHLPLMQQTVLLELCRGPDGVTKYDPSKFLMRWVRRCILISAFDGRALLTPYDEGGGSFTGPSYKQVDRPDDTWQDAMQDLVSSYLRGVDAMPHHFHLHLMHGVEILGYKHPTHDVREFWRMVYLRFCNDMHVSMETEEEMDRRLGDSRAAWLERADPATAA